MSTPKQSQTGSSIVWRDAPTTSVNVGGTQFAYRHLGPDTGVPVIFLNHLAAEPPVDLSRTHHPVLVANGDHDKMVPSSNSVDLARRLPNAELVLYEDAGHGGIFQCHEAFVKKALEFLEV